MKRVHSESRRSRFGGVRVTLFDDRSEPTVSVWGESHRGLYDRAVELERATPEPIDAILQATLWHGKEAQA